MTLLTPEIDYCRATVKSWERLRLLYNAILLVPGVLLLWRTVFLHKHHGWGELPAGVDGIAPGDPLSLAAQALIFGLVANICYCLGPYVEFVVTALGFPITGQRSRYLIFGLGTMVSLAVIGCAWQSVEFSAASLVTPAP